MNTPSAPHPEKPPAGGTNGSADDAVPLTPDRSESALGPAGCPGPPDRDDGSGPGGDDEYDDYEYDDDEYEPL